MNEHRETVPPVRTLPLGQNNLPDRDACVRAFAGIFERNFFANHGPLEAELDEALADYLGVKHAVCVANGAIALLLMARATNINGNVIVPALAPFGTLQALSWAGLQPVYCDVSLVSHTLTAEQVNPLLDGQVAAIWGAHWCGRLCDVDHLAQLAAEHRLKLIFDAAQAMGCGNGRRKVGGFGDAETFSLHADHIINGGAGGCITTNDDALAARLRTMRTFHETQATVPVTMRVNGKMSEAQAALGLLSLRDIEINMAANKKRYRHYQRVLGNIEGMAFVDYAAGQIGNFQTVVVEVDTDKLRVAVEDIIAALAREKIDAAHYASSLATRHALGRDGQYPNAERLARRLIQLPNSQNMQLCDIDRVCDVLKTIGRP